MPSTIKQQPKKFTKNRLQSSLPYYFDMEEPLMMETNRMRSASPLCFDWPEAADDILNDVFLDRGDNMNRSRGNLEFPDGSSADLLHPGPGCSSGIDTTLDDKETGDVTSKARTVTSKKRSLSKSDAVSAGRRKKKPKGMPKRPLSAYNLYFQSERAAVQARAEKEDDSKKLGFEGLGKVIGKQWRELSDEDRKKYEKLAEKDSVRYRNEMEIYKQEKSRKIAEDEQEKFSLSMGGQRSNEIIYGRSLLNNSPQQEEKVYGPFSARPQDEGNLLQPQYLPAIFPRAKSPFDGLAAPPAQRPQQILSFPPPPPESYASDGNNLLLPPGMEIILADRNGKDRKYCVEYKCYSMSREEAHNYIESVTGAVPTQPSAAADSAASATSNSNSNTERASQFGGPWENGLPCGQQEYV
jgi:hypothetical protein